MVKIINFFKKIFDDYAQAYTDVNDIGIYIIPTGYSYIVMYLSPELTEKIKNTDQTYSANSNQ